MIGGGRRHWLERALHCAAGAGVALLVLLTPAVAAEQLLPTGFFQNLPQIGTSNVAVTANSLTYNADRHEVIADGDVEVRYNDYVFNGDHLVFDQRAGTAHFVGNVVVHTPDQTVYRAPDLKLSSAMHEALMRDLTISTPGGAMIVADEGRLRSGEQTLLTHSTYSPCGKCIDAKGNRIGWSVKSARMIYDNKTSNVTLEQPSLYLLGIPVAWLPWLSMPDPSKRLNRFLMPSVDYSAQLGGLLRVPYFIAAGPDTDIILTPALTTRQGFLMSGEWDQRFPKGSTVVRVSGIYQRDPAAFAPMAGADHDFRGAIQTYGSFRPTSEWTVGWSYSAFTDPAFFTDYRINTDLSATNEVYATRLAQDEFFDFRVQQFNLLGNITTATLQNPSLQGLALPRARYHKVLYLPQEMGQIDFTANLLGVRRAGDDARTTLGTLPYDFGREENKTHAMVEASWQRRWIVPGGFVATPFLGLRADAAYADYYPAANRAAPLQQVSLFNITPIAAIDVRYPMVARTEGATHVVEPIAQLVYRGSDTSAVGITNDDAQSFILDDTNLFSYNRFTGQDRQETGLRANIGAHYQVSFDNGGWFDVVAGQSFQLAGSNAFAAADPTQVTTGQGMDGAASYMVLGAQGSVIKGLVTAAKLQVDPGGRGITRAGANGTYSTDGYTFGLDYLFTAKNAARGVTSDRQEATASVSLPVPFVDYWRVTAYGGWDITANQWLSAGVAATYDDGYLTYGGSVTATGPTNNTTANDLRFLATINLKGLH